MEKVQTFSPLFFRETQLPSQNMTCTGKANLLRFFVSVQTLTGLTGSSSQLNRTLSGIINTKKEGYHDAVDSTLWMIESGGEQIDLTNNGRIISKNSLSHVQQKLQIS